MIYYLVCLFIYLFIMISLNIKAARELDAILYKQNVLQYLENSKSWRYSILEWRKKQWENNSQYWNDECLRSSSESSKQVKRAYVTFESEEGYKRCLKYFPKSIGKYFDNSECLLEGKQIQTIPAEVSHIIINFIIFMIILY